MRIVMFVHSIRSCWLPGDVHFLRGVAGELLARGHAVAIYEPRDGASARRLVDARGPTALYAYHASYPNLDPILYVLDELELERALDRADLVLVNAATPSALVSRIGEIRRGRTFRLLFHDSRPRAFEDPGPLLVHYDGVLASVEPLRELYLLRGWIQRAWTWREGADTRVFRPHPEEGTEEDLVWEGDWGDGERLDAFLLQPAREARLSGVVYGPRYSLQARTAIAAAGLQYEGWLANHQLPRVFGQHRLTVHVPRAPRFIRLLEAFACGIPVIGTPLSDAERLFEPGVHFLSAQTSRDMAQHMRLLVGDASAARELAHNARKRVLEEHTCAHRVDALVDIVNTLRSVDQTRWMEDAALLHHAQ